VLDLGERRMRAEIAALPDGEYRAEDAMNNDCFEAGHHAIRLGLRIAGETLIADFTGTDPQIRGFKNSSIANTHSAVYVGLASFLDPRLPGNEGTFRPVTVIAPEGTLVNPRPPAPMTMNTLAPGTEIIHAVWKALGQADPARSCAGWGKNAMPTMSGRRPDGAQYVMYHWAAGVGAGAVDGRDGFNATSGLVALGALYLPDLELYEQQYPVRFLRQEFRTDSAGAGTYRGGTGIDYAIEVESPAIMALRGEGLRTPSGFGVGGAWSGAHGELAIVADGGRSEPPQYGILATGPMQLTIAGAAGGGWGDPRERDPARVLRDVRDGVVSATAAREIYRVAIATGGKSIDEQATAVLRNRL
jgi:N-methylhydantoinase B